MDDNQCLSLPYHASLVNSWLLGKPLWGRAEAILANEYVQRAQPQLQVFNAAELQLAISIRCSDLACRGGPIDMAISFVLTRSICQIRSNY